MRVPFVRRLVCSPSLSLCHLFATHSALSLSTLGVSIFIPLCIFTYFLARNIKVASIVLLPNIVWLLLLPGSGGCMGEAVGCVFAKLWLPGYLSLFLLCVRVCASVCVCHRSCARPVCLRVHLVFIYIWSSLIILLCSSQAGILASTPLATWPVLPWQSSHVHTFRFPLGAYKEMFKYMQIQLSVII